MTTLQRSPRVRLEIIEVPNPCPADWSAMTAVDGDRVRHCKHCDHHVYNLSALPRNDAERLVARQMAGEGQLCVRMTKRLDGTVTTTDCAGRWRAAAMRLSLRWGGPIGAGLALVVALLGGKETVAATPPGSDTTPLMPVTSGMVVRPPASTQPDTTQPIIDPSTQPADSAPTLMGRIEHLPIQRPTTQPLPPG